MRFVVRSGWFDDEFVIGGGRRRIEGRIQGRARLRAVMRERFVFATFLATHPSTRTMGQVVDGGKSSFQACFVLRPATGFRRGPCRDFRVPRSGVRLISPPRDEAADGAVPRRAWCGTCARRGVTSSRRNRT